MGESHRKSGARFDPKMETAFLLALLVAAVALFATEKIPVDVITVLLLAALTVTGILTPRQAFEGFSNDIIVILASIFVIGAALQRSGLLEAGAATLLRFSKAGVKKLTVLLMGVSAVFSAFMNNTTVTALFVSPAAGLAQSAGLSPSRLLMPLAFASIMGGTCTLIGTSTNVAVSGYIEKAGMEPVHMFELLPIGLVIVAVGILYFLLFGARLLPNVTGDTALTPETIRDYLCEVVVMPGSPLIGQSTFDWDLSLIGFRLVRLERAGQDRLPSADLFIEEGDLLLVQGRVTDLLRVKKIEGLEFKASLEPDEVGGRHGDVLVAETVILPDSDMAGLTLKEANLRRTHDLMVLAISRHGQSRLRDMGSMTLRTGDVLLVQGRADRVDSIRRGSGFAVLDEYEPPTLRWKQGLTTAALFLAAIVIGSLGWLPLSVALLTAAVLIVLIGALPGDQVREVIDWRMLVLIGGMTAFGTAMEETHTAEFLAQGVISVLGPMGDLAVLGGFFILTILLTQPMSNAAAALVVLPVAMKAATELGADPRAFAIGVMIAASISFIAPLEPSCVIVYGPGRYRFFDFVRVGGLLTLLLVVVVLPLVPLLWPLR